MKYIAVLMLLILAGCGSYTARVQGIDHPLPGVVHDVRMILCDFHYIDRYRNDVLIPMIPTPPGPWSAMVDLPMSLVVDVILLPWDLLKSEHD